MQGIIRQRTTDNDVKKYCVECLEKIGSFEYTKQTLIKLEERLVNRTKKTSVFFSPYFTTTLYNSCSIICFILFAFDVDN